jgi:hypothetical protein
MFLTIVHHILGYGDFSPNNNASKLFAAAYALFGLAILAGAIGGFVEIISEEKEKLKKNIIRMKCIRDMKSDEDDDEDEDDGEDNPTIFTRIAREISESYEKRFGHIPRHTQIHIRNLVLSMISVLLNILVGTIGYKLLDHFSLVDSIFLSCITITTVGYGNIAPTNDKSRVFTIIYAFFGTIITANALGNISNSFINYKKDSILHTELSRDLDVKQLLDMDIDHSSKVTKDEFVMYKLVRMGIVDIEILKLIEKNFDNLDHDKNGYLSVEDFTTSVRKRGRRVQSGPQKNNNEQKVTNDHIAVRKSIIMQKNDTSRNSIISSPGNARVVPLREEESPNETIPSYVNHQSEKNKNDSRSHIIEESNASGGGKAQIEYFSNLADAATDDIESALETTQGNENSDLSHNNTNNNNVERKYIDTNEMEKHTSQSSTHNPAINHLPPIKRGQFVDQLHGPHVLTNRDVSNVSVFTEET